MGPRFQIYVGLVWAWGAAFGCTGVPAAFSCTSDAQCDVAGSRGRCEPTGTCSVVDSACASGRRYDSSAAAALARQCVGDLPDLGAKDGTPDGGGLVAGGPSLCDALGPADGLIACTGFEGTANTVSLFQTNGSTTFDTSRFYRGTSSVHLQVMSGTTQSKFAQPQYKNLPTSPSMYAVRAFVFFPNAGAGATRLLSFQQPGPTTFRSDHVWMQEDGHLSVSHASPSGAPTTIDSTAVMPFGRWVCLELRVTWGTGSAGNIRVLLDDAAVSDLDFDGTTTDSPPLTDAILGISYDAPAPSSAYEMWMDELVIASQPIGCAK